MKRKKRKKESQYHSRNDERKWREERPTESEEWMLNLQIQQILSLDMLKEPINLKTIIPLDDIVMLKSKII